MESIREIFKVGYGPSSSHTIGPRKAAEIFKEHNPQATSFRTTLYGSLGATGKGHLTDKAIEAALSPSSVEIVWKGETVLPFHTNGMLFEAIDADGKVLDNWTVFSIGGGSLSEGETPRGYLVEDKKRVIEYPINKLTPIRLFIAEQGMTYWELVREIEGEDIYDFLCGIWKQMQESVEEGLTYDDILPGGLNLHSKAKKYLIRSSSLKDSLRTRAQVAAYTLAVCEMNARGGKVVTAPTCGSCGVLPGVLYHMKHNHGFDDDDIVKALATAGLFANIIKDNASLSGAEVGCQGEVGSACVMAAAAVNQLFGGSVNQIECAAEMAMEHNLGLTCDPVCGLVQIPCIERNAVASLRALDVSLYAFVGDGKPTVPFDSIIETMKETGHDISSQYKETAQGGLATVYLRERQKHEEIKRKFLEAISE